MDKQDKKILYLLHKNSRTPVTSIARMVKLSKDAVNLRIQNLCREGIIEDFTISINHRALGFTIYTVFLRFVKFTDSDRSSIISMLRRTPYVTYVAACSGNWDLWVEVLADSIERFDKVLGEIMNSIAPNLRDYKALVTISEYKTYSPLLESFFEKFLDRQRRRKKKKVAAYSIDRTDYLILKKLEKHSRIPLVHLAQELELTVDVVRYRVRRLEEQAIIRGYTIQLDFDKMGYSVYLCSLYFRSLTVENERKLRHFFDSNTNIRLAYKAAGRQEIIIEVLTKDIREFQEVLNTIRNRFYDILDNYEYLIVIEDYKDIIVPVLPF